MAEAMMWGLPLVVSNWRGNREVAGPEAEIFEIGPLMIENMATALLRLVKQPETWAEKSKMSRRRFHRLYRRVGPVYPDVVADLLRSESSK
jgi:glycosyltransferase involved in cell wall biosynthesis